MKRLFDIVVTLLAVPVVLPASLVIAFAIRMRLGSPVLFIQERPGLAGRPFRLFKFRTMIDSRCPEGDLLPDADRLTRLGRILRNSSLDELPEFWNVLKGDMSLVGPRPLLAEYLPLYSPMQARRHEVRPGITGWAQINGRNALTWDEKFAYDVWYVDNRSLWLDIRILGRTALSVLSGHGIAAPGHSTMPPFEGNQRAAGKK